MGQWAELRGADVPVLRDSGGIFEQPGNVARLNQAGQWAGSKVAAPSSEGAVGVALRSLRGLVGGACTWAPPSSKAHLHPSARPEEALGRVRRGTLGGKRASPPGSRRGVPQRSGPGWARHGAGAGPACGGGGGGGCPRPSPALRSVPGGRR